MADVPVRGKYYDDLAIGEEFVSSRRTVSEATIDAFAGTTGDFSEVHMDGESMRDTEFGDRIGHGLLSLSLMQGLMWQTGFNVGTVVATIGWDRVRFAAPLKAGDTVQARWSIKDKRLSRSRPGFGITVEECRLVNQRKETVLTGEHVSLVRCRPAPPGPERPPRSAADAAPPARS
jgi:acyl dehydratase